MRNIGALIAITGGAVLGLALGFHLRNLTGPRYAGQSAALGSSSSTQTGVSVTNSVRHRGRHVQADDSPLASRLARDLSMSAGVTNWLCWWQALAQAAPTDFPRLLQLAKDKPLLRKMIVERWSDIAPQQFFRTAVEAARAGAPFSFEVTSQLLGGWVKRDPGAVVTALKEAGDFPGQRQWQMEVASSIIQNNVEQGLQLMSEWHIENFEPDMKGVQAWAAADPRHAAEFTLANPAGYVSSETMKRIGQEWAKSAPVDALNFAVAQPGQLGAKLAGSVLQTWASQDLNAAADWLAAADPSVQNKLCPGFVEAWAQKDPAAALAWCEANNTGSSLLHSVSSLFTGAAQKDVAAAGQLVLGMEPSPARSEAAAVVADKWVPEPFGTQKPVSAETLSWLYSLDPDSVARVLDRVQWKWSSSDPATMAAFLQSTNTVEVPSFAYSNLARDMARKDPAQALDWAAQLPQGLGLSAGSTAFGEWGRAQPELAMEWWKALPAGDPRRAPFLDNLLSQLAWDPQANAQFAQVAANDPGAALKLLGTMHLDEPRRTALMNLVSQK